MLPSRFAACPAAARWLRRITLAGHTFCRLAGFRAYAAPDSSLLRGEGSAARRLSTRRQRWLAYAGAILHRAGFFWAAAYWPSAHDKVALYCPASLSRERSALADAGRFLCTLPSILRLVLMMIAGPASGISPRDMPVSMGDDFDSPVWRSPAAARWPLADALRISTLISRRDYMLSIFLGGSGASDFYRFSSAIAALRCMSRRAGYAAGSRHDSAFFLRAIKTPPFAIAYYS